MSAVSSLGNKVIYRYLGFRFQTFVKQNASIILSPFPKGLGPFQLSKNPSHTPSCIYLISGNKPCPMISNLFQYMHKVSYIQEIIQLSLT